MQPLSPASGSTTPASTSAVQSRTSTHRTPNAQAQYGASI
jgi:hypothetical protein